MHTILCETTNAQTSDVCCLNCGRHFERHDDTACTERYMLCGCESCVRERHNERSRWAAKVADGKYPCAACGRYTKGQFCGHCIMEREDILLPELEEPREWSYGEE